MNRLLNTSFCVMAAASFASAALAADATRQAEEIVEATGIQGGLLLHLGCGDAALTAGLASTGRYVVHGMDGDTANVARARRRIAEAGLESRATVEHFRGGVLPLNDHLVNLVVVEDFGDVSIEEITRVLAPGGAACVRREGRWTTRFKPRPAEIDAWTHYLHGPDGNAVASDALVGPPRRLQWFAGPPVARHHDVTASVTAIVSDGPRLYYIIDEGPPSLMNFAPDWKLVARDAFNGVLLWKRAIPTWIDHLRPFRSGPPQLPRRLVALDGKVFATLGFDAPVAVLDAASGVTLRVFDETQGTDEILVSDDVLLAATCDWADDAATRRGGPTEGSPRSIKAISLTTGDVLWQRDGPHLAALRPTTLAAAADRLVYQSGSEVVCLDVPTGARKWTYAHAETTQQAKRGKKPVYTASYFSPTIVICPSEGVVLAADRGRLTALSLDGGEPLWSSPAPADFHAPADVFVADGLVWSGIFATEGRDPRSGEVRRTLDIEELLTPGHHPRCYRNKATERFVIAGKRGMEFMDLSGNRHSRNNWARGGCQYGIMPCNGMTYLPPNACCCYPGALLRGFTALLPEGGLPSRSSDTLEPGPAWGDFGDGRPRRRQWPTYRGDVLRSGAARESLLTAPEDLWSTEVGGRLTPPIVADGRVFVASVEQRRVTALDAASGRHAWSFTAGGRVDTPPTFWQGTILFGAKDGWVYCLRAGDGALVWRFRAAPEDRRTVVDDQLESLWPVHGNVLVIDSVAYFAAGRSAYLDGGIWLYGLDAATGKKLHEARFVIPHDEAPTQAFVMAGARPDVLVSDGEYIYLQQIKFDTELNRQEGRGRHLMTNDGFADDTWFYRTFWRLGCGDVYDFPFSYIKHDLQVPFGQLLVFDDRTVCGLQTHISPGIVPAGAESSSRGCLLFGDANRSFSPDAEKIPASDFPPKVVRPKVPGKHRWTVNLPLQARAMLLAENALFVGGWPDDGSQDERRAARAGETPGRLSVFSPADGSKIAERGLAAGPVFDGMAAADGRLIVSLKNGTVVCLGQKGRTEDQHTQ